MRAASCPRRSCHLQVHTLQSPEADRHAFGSNRFAAHSPFGDGGLADARPPDSIRNSARSRDTGFEHLLNFLVAAEHRRQLVLARQQVQVRRECFRNGGQLETASSGAPPRSSMSRIRCCSTRYEHFRLHAVAAENRDRDALRFLEHGRKESAASSSDAGPAGVMERQFENELWSPA